MAKRKSISYSQFSQWDKCPYMWKLNYVDRLSVFTDNIHTLFGTSMHEVLQEYLRVMYTKSIKEADQLYLDGILFTIWLGILYYGKCWIDSKFKRGKIK